jgi:hypothetical protein
MGNLGATAKPARFRGVVAVVVVTLGLTSMAECQAAGRNYPDLCGAGKLTGYIGRPIEELERLHLDYARFLCVEDCVGTADVQPARVTVHYSKKTGRVLKVFCN